MSECRPDRGRDPKGTADPTVERIRDRGEAVRDRQVERALSELEGELSERERAAVEALGDHLVERLLAVPEAQLRRAAREGDDERVRRALALFG